MFQSAQRLSLTPPQFRLVTSQAPFPALVAGFGAGKTEALVIRAIALKSLFWDCNIAYYMPTFDLIKQIAWPRFDEKFELHKIKATLNRSDHWYTFRNDTKLVFRSMDKPSRIIGYEVADSFIDELDTLKIEEARNVWNKVVARNRQKKRNGVKNTIAVGTTPEGFKFVYERWQKDVKLGYELIRASTYSNQHNLPDDYVSTLQDLYPTQLVQAYLEGEFVNLTTGSVYPEFDRKLNNSEEQIRGPVGKEKGEPLFIGMDFNVGKMAAVVFVRRDGWPHAVAELTGILDTPTMIEAIKRRWPHHFIRVYPDASGDSRKTNNASKSDIALLRDAGFDVMVDRSNPAVKDRVLSINSMINVRGNRRLRVNSKTCSDFVETLEKQVYDKNGEPDKTSGLDHAGDAGGYFICHEFPVVRRSSQRVPLLGI